ncbi:MAG: septal ring lytic transglycosylase RlpA family protein [Thermodesulfobacteriota bacterium]
MRRLSLFFLLLLLTMSGCTGRDRAISVPAKKWVATPGKYDSTDSKVPGTQRPYEIKGKTYYPLPSAEGFEQKGIASWYGKPFHGRKTSNGETYNMYSRTAAHKTLPMNTHVLVKNLENGKEMVLRINDRGPFVRGRIIDLSRTGAKELGVLAKGTARVHISALGEAVTVQEEGKRVKRFLPHENFNRGNFYVQIGSFTNRDNALRLKVKMEGKGYEMAVRTYNRGDKIFHRVQVRAGFEMANAKKELDLLTQMGYSGSFIVAQ